MQPWTAVSMIGAGAGAAWNAAAVPGHERALRVAWIAVAALNAVFLVQYAIGAAPGFDTLLFSEAVGGQDIPNPGRTSPLAAALLFCWAAGAAIVDLNLRWWRLFTILAVGGFLVSITTVTGLLYSFNSLFEGQHLNQVAPATAFCLLLLFCSLACIRQRGGWLRILDGEDAGGMLVRRLLPAVIAGPLLIGGAVIWISRAIVINPDERMAIAMTVVMAVIGGGVMLAARTIARIQGLKDEAHRRLMASEARYRTVFAQAAVGMGQVALDGRLIQVNARLAGMLGYSVAEVEGRSFEDLTDPEDFDRERPLVEDLLGGRRDTYIIEKRYLRKDGRPLWVRVTSSIVREEGYRISVVEDISGQKAAEQDLREARDEALRAKVVAEKASRAKSAFLAAASHDLRQPAQSLVMFASLLETRLKGHPSAQVVGILQEAVKALNTVLDGILDVSRIDAGLVEVRLRDLALDPLFRRLEEEYRPIAAAKGLELRFDGSDLAVCSDAVHLERILRNLLTNALKFTSTGWVAVRARAAGEFVLIEVEDTGEGIAPEHREAVFEEFFQVGNPERDRRQGLGLGLAIVKRLAAQVGLRIALSSERGKGSVFTIELPRGSVQEIAETPEQRRLLRGGLVLLIEDEALVRRSLALVLSQWGLEVLEADSAGGALAALGPRCPDLILADYRLRNGRTGDQAVAAVREHCGKQVPAFLLTGDTSPDRLRLAKESNLLIMHKPVAFPTLYDAIARSIED